MQLWWELHERYEEALLKHTQFDTDEDFMEQSGLITVDNGKSGKKKKNSSASSESEASPETTEGELSGESDKSDNEDLPDYKENGYHAVHVG